MKEFQLAKDILDKSHAVVLVPGEDSREDTFASALAFFSILRKLNKETMILAQEIPPKLRFLQEKNILSPPEAVLAIDVEGKRLNQLRYEKTVNQLKIYLNLEGGSLAQSDIALSQPLSFILGPRLSFSPDVILALGITKKEGLEKKEGFPNVSRTPVINIDCGTDNERFGSLNIIDSHSPCVSQLIGNFLLAHYENIFDDRIATILFAGLLLGTQNFRHPKTGPQTLEQAAILLEKGGDHQLVVKYLYKTKSVPQLRLLGRALEHLEFNEPKGITVVTISGADFKETGTSSKDLAFVFEELKTNFWRNNSLLLLWESQNSYPLIKGIFISKNPSTTKQLLQHTEGISRGKTALFILRKTLLEDAKKEVFRILEKSIN